jgi:hypothetical protein
MSMAGTRWQRFVANHWLNRLWLIAGAAGGCTWVISETRGVFDPPVSWIAVLCMIVSVVVAAGVGFFVACILAGALPILRGVYWLQIRLNGGPFLVGDRVTVLVGPHAGALGKIREEWQGTYGVRVDIDGAEVTDDSEIFVQYQLIRAGTN